MEQVMLLKGEECRALRPLWEAVFHEDSEAFNDYYFSYKVPANTALALRGEEGYRSMLYLTPYRLSYSSGRAFDSTEVSYIVGVATAQEYRREGRMGKLLQDALLLLNTQRQPFTFLMPAAEAIYTPYQFTYIYEKPQWRPASELGRQLEIFFGIRDSTLREEGVQLKCERKVLEAAEDVRPAVQRQKPSVLLLRPMRAEDIPAVSQYSQALLQSRYQMFAARNKQYYRLLSLEMEAQNGCVLVITDADRIIGYAACGVEYGRIEIQDVLVEPSYEDQVIHYEEKRTPCIMARITHVQRLLSMVGCRRSMEITFRLEDPLIPDNSGYYTWQADSGTVVVRQQPLTQEPDTAVCFQVTCEGLLTFLFGRSRAQEVFTGLCGYEWEQKEVLGQLRDAFTPIDICINEIV